MPWKTATGVEGCDGVAVVKKDSGKLVACHKTRAEADAQVRALYANEAQTAAAVGALARELLEEGGLVARGLYEGPGGKTTTSTEIDEVERDISTGSRRPFRPELHPRHPAGVREGGRFKVKGNDAGRFEVIAPNGLKVGEAIEEADAEAMAREADARATVGRESPASLRELPNEWAVEQGYADWTPAYVRSQYQFGRGYENTEPGAITWKRDVDQEAVLVHYLTGEKPQNFPVGTRAWEQWMYGRRLPAGSSPQERDAMKNIKRRTKAEREETVRRLTAALAACGFVVAGDEPDEALVASFQAELQLNIYEGALTAAVTIPATPPGTWFRDPALDRPTPLTVTADGRVYGHLALWDSCHIGEPGGAGVCVAPPRSGTGYSLFHLGEVETAEGELVATGKITLGTGHASLQASRNAAASHYDNTGSVVADVRAGEDRHGIWVNGALRPGLDEGKVRELRAAGISGDWRRYRNALELVAALAVNVPGFPIPRVAALVAPELEGDERLSLVAAGVILEPVPMELWEVNARIDALGLLAGVAEL